MPYFSVDPECVLGTTMDCIRFPEINPKVFGAVELTDEEVQQLVELIRENDGETDIEELELADKYPEIYEKLDDAYLELAYQAAYRTRLVQRYRDGDFEVPYNLMEWLDAEQLFRFEIDPKEGPVTAEALQDLKRKAFDKWLNEYTAGLDVDQLFDFLNHYYDTDLIDMDNFEPEDYLIEIPEEIVEMAGEK